MTNKFQSRRRVEDVPKINGRDSVDYAQDLEDYLRKSNERAEGGIPAGFNDLTPVTVGMGGTADPGTELAGWMAGDAALVVAAAAPSVPVSLGSSAAVGSLSSGLRSDMTLNTTTLAAQVRALVSLRVG